MHENGDESRSGTLLGAAAVCCLLGVLGVGAALGAVLPPIGDVLGVDGHGVGGMLGYLLGAAFFGGFGVVLAVLWRRGRPAIAPPEGARPDDAVLEQDVLPLPKGPGLAVRWLAAVPLMLFATLLPLVGTAGMLAWSDLAFSDRVSAFDDEPAPTFGAEFWENLSMTWVTVFVPVVVIAGFLIRRTRFAAWPVAVLWIAGWQLLPMALIGSALNDAPLADFAFTIGLFWLSYELARATVRILSWPIAADVVGSDLEIPYRLPGQRPRLRVQHDRLVLDRLSREKNGTRKLVIPWPEVRDVRLIDQEEDDTWSAAGVTIEVPAGPALRIRNAKRAWLIPVSEYTGESLIAAITARAAAKERQTV